jgi:hypothetical protein
MGFFESLVSEPAPDAEPARMPAWFKPAAVLPGSVGMELLLAHNDEAAVAISNLNAYPSGFSFTLVAVLRGADRSGALSEFLRGPHRAPDPQDIPDAFVRLGIQFADGTVASNVGDGGLPAMDVMPDGPVLAPLSGGGGVHRYDLDHWVWPLPPPGPVTFVCAWPVVGIGESTITIDAATIAAAAARSVVLWPEDEAP